jgi:hypothetical protein
MITDLKNLSKGQHFRFKEVNGQKTNEKRVYKFVKIALKHYLVFVKAKDNKKYPDIFQYTMKDQIKVEVLPQQGGLFKSKIYPLKSKIK